jgi:hypothetical protein
LSRTSTPLGHAEDGELVTRTYALTDGSMDKGSLARKISEVTAAVKHPPQSGFHKFNKFHYSTRDDIFGVIRGELAQRKVAVLPSILSVRHEDTGRTTKSGNPISRIVVRVSVALVDSESGEEFEQTWEGESHTDDDKGVQQAVTQALRFWATNTFMLLDGSDEQLHGNAGTQNETVHRQSADSPADTIKARLKRLGFSDQQQNGFLQFIATTENVGSIADVHPGRLQMWASRMNASPDNEARDKVLNVLNEQEAA